MRPATSLGPPAANGTTRVSGRLGQFCAAAVAGKASKASIAANAGRRALITRFLLMHMVRSWLCPRGAQKRGPRIIASLRQAGPLRG
jgi:hypothetical protein